MLAWRSLENAKLWTFVWPFDLWDLRELWGNLSEVEVEVGVAAGTNFVLGCAESCAEACVGPREQDCVGLLEPTEKATIVGRKGRERDWSVLWWTSVLTVSMEYVRVEEVDCSRGNLGLSLRTDQFNRVKLCEFTAARTDCSGDMEGSGWLQVRLSHCGGQVSLCIERAQGTHCVKIHSEPFRLLRQQVSPMLTGRKVQWQCVSAELPRALLPFNAPRRLTSTHYAKWMLHRTIPVGDTHYYSFVNTHVDTTSITLRVKMISNGTQRPSVYFYKPFSATPDWSITADGELRILILTPTDPVIIAKGGSLAGSYTIKVYNDKTLPIEYDAWATVACQDISGDCFCPVGQFPNTDTASCSACPAGNDRCPEILSLGCIPVTENQIPALNNFNCHTCFPNTEYLSQGAGTCSDCGPSCATCTGPGPNNCSGCHAGTTLGLSGGLPVCVCDTGTYPTPSAPNCSPCHIYCLDCVGPGGSKCSSCKSNASLFSFAPSMCVCNSGFYGMPNLCGAIGCSLSCATCSGTNCLTCKSGAVLVGGVPGACECNTGYYGSPGACSACAPECLSCAGNSGSQCSGCKAYAALLNSVNPGTCICNSGFFPDSTSANCKACDSTCLSCNGALDFMCSACVATIATLSAGIPSSCLCSDGYYGMPPNCLGCDGTCSKCVDVGATQCTACQLDASLVSGTINSCECNSGFFPDTTSASCKACDGTCLSCNGATASLCTACYPNASLPSSVSTGSCTCLNGFYPNLTSANCSVCHPLCLLCSTSGPMGCTSCQSGLIHSGGLPSACICLSGFYQSGVNCLPCHSTCLQCNSGVSTACSECHPLAVLTLPIGSCICETGYFANPTSANCSLCHKTCYTCMGSTVSDCLSCKAYAELASSWPSVCRCSRGSAPLPDASNCVLCDLTCKSCFNADAEKCLSCMTNAELSAAAPSACTCKSGFYPNPNSSNCLLCALVCLTCSSVTECLSCKSGATLQGDTCVCEVGYYTRLDASQCQMCSLNCDLCDLTGCLQCSVTYFLLYTYCVTECPPHYSAISSVCEPQPPVPSLSATSSNSLLISFDQNMTFPSLSSEDFSISVSTLKAQVEITWSIPLLPDSRSFILNLTFTEPYLPANSTATLTFLTPTSLVSSLNVPIALSTLSTELHPFGTLNTSALSSPAAIQASTMAQCTIAALVVSSIITGDPAALATFVGSLQLMSYIAIAAIELPKDLMGTLAALNMGAAFSIPYADRLDTGEKSQQTEGYVKSYGIDSSLFLVNMSVFLGTAGAIVGSFVPIYLLSKVSPPSVSAYCARILPSLKWGVPLRLWLPAYLDVCIYSLLQVLNSSFSTPYLTCNLFIACAFALAAALTPITMCVLLQKSSHLMVSRNDEEFNKKWGALFTELEANPAANCLYLVYSLRRLAFALSLVLANDYPSFTMLLSCAMSLASLVYLSSAHCFAEPVDHSVSLLTEGGVLAVYTAVGAFLIDLPAAVVPVVTALGVWAARGTVLVNLAAAVFRSVGTVWQVVRTYRAVQRRTARIKSLL